MIHLTHNLPENKKFFLACSGGVDSMAALHWLSQGKRKPYGIIYIHHNTGDYADSALRFVISNASKYCDNVIIKKITDVMPPKVSKENWWRQKRYQLFNETLETSDKPYPIVLAHNLDDCVEQYIMSTMIRIKPYPLISYYGPSNTIRPFRTWAKKDIYEYAKRKDLPWLEDPSNKDTRYTRNKIRHEVLPLVASINPGIYSHVKSLIIEDSEK